MDILINDVIQYSDAPSEMRTPSLADVSYTSTVTITLDKVRTVTHIGVGNTDATMLSVNGQTLTLEGVGVYRNGLYILATPITSDTLVVSHNGLVLGRFAAGMAHTMGVKPTREPGLYSTESNRTTVSGQVIPGAGGVTGRTIQVDTRYRFTGEMFDDLQEAYSTQQGRGFPMFLNFEKELAIGWIPWARLYGQLSGSAFVLQSSVNKTLYSKKFKFAERF